MIYQKTSLVEGVHHTGALKKKHDFRDRKYSRLYNPYLATGSGPIPFDWTTSVDFSEGITVEDQGSSDSCGGQALRYYTEALTKAKKGTSVRLSARDPYSQIFYPGGGTTINDVGNIAVRKGINTEAIVPSYQNGLPPDEPFMETKAAPGLDVGTDLFEEAGYAFPNTDIDTIAAAIRDNTGCIIEIYGQNNGTWLSPFPLPPTAVPGDWAHFLYACGAMTINGQKYIKVINSWGTSVGTNGFQWLPESYFNGFVPHAIVFYDNSINPYNPTAWQSFVTWFNNFFQQFQG